MPYFLHLHKREETAVPYRIFDAQRQRPAPRKVYIPLKIKPLFVFSHRSLTFGSLTLDQLKTLNRRPFVPIVRQAETSLIVF